MSAQSFELAFYTVGNYEGLSGDDTARVANIDISEQALGVAASLQSARNWLLEQHAGLDMECAAEVPLRGYFAFKGTDVSEGLNVDTAQLVCLDEGYVVRAHLENGVWVETDLIELALPA